MSIQRWILGGGHRAPLRLAWLHFERNSHEGSSAVGCTAVLFDGSLVCAGMGYLSRRGYSRIGIAGTA